VRSNVRKPRGLSGTCHCGAISVEVPTRPEKVTLCNCSLCRRVGALWAYYPVATVKVTGHPEHTDAYIWGDRTLGTLRCRHCGCVTHWEPLERGPDAHMAVNVRNFDPNELDNLRIRRFDGANTWTYLD
jgi:hypothetical protein